MQKSCLFFKNSLSDHFYMHWTLSSKLVSLPISIRGQTLPLPLTSADWKQNIPCVQGQRPHSGGPSRSSFHDRILVCMETYSLFFLEKTGCWPHDPTAGTLTGWPHAFICVSLSPWQRSPIHLTQTLDNVKPVQINLSCTKHLTNIFLTFIVALTMKRENRIPPWTWAVAVAGTFW